MLKNHTDAGMAGAGTGTNVSDLSNTIEDLVGRNYIEPHVLRGDDDIGDRLNLFKATVNRGHAALVVNHDGPYIYMCLLFDGPRKRYKRAIPKPRSLPVNI